MHTLTALAQTTESTSWTPLVMVGFMGAMAVVLGLARLLRRILTVVSHLLVSAGTAMAALATILAMGTMFTTVLVFLNG